MLTSHTDIDWEMDEARRLARLCQCGTKKPPEIRYDPGVTYIVCECSDQSRFALPDWDPKGVVRYWNERGYLTVHRIKKRR